MVAKTLFILFLIHMCGQHYVLVGTTRARWRYGSVLHSCNKEHHQRCWDHHCIWLQLSQVVRDFCCDALVNHTGCLLCWRC